MLGTGAFKDCAFIAESIAQHADLFDPVVIETMGSLVAEFSAKIGSEPSDIFWLTQIARLEYVQTAMLAVQRERHNPLNEDAVRIVSHLIMSARYQVEVD